MITVPFFVARETVGSRSYQFNNETRDSTCFVIIQRTLEGCGAFYLKGRRFDVPPGRAFVAIVPEMSSYAYEGPGRMPWTFSWLNFYGGPAADLCRLLRDMHGPVVPLAAGTAAGRMFDDLVRARRRRNPVTEASAAYTFLITWAGELGGRTALDQDPIENALRKMRRQFHEPLGVKMLAADCGLSREHFTRRFAGATGIPPAAFLRDIRVRQARRLMRTGSNRLKEVALRCGFPSLAAMKRAFRKSPT